MQNLGSGSGLGAFTSGLGQVAQGVTAYRAGMANAQIADQNAHNALVDGAQAQASSNARYRAAIGQQLATQGGSGFQMGTGSMLDAINQSRINQTYAAMQISQQAQNRSIAYGNEASAARSSATGKLIGGIINGTSAFLGRKMDYANANAGAGYGGPDDAGGAITATAMGAGGALDQQIGIDLTRGWDMSGTMDL